MDPREREEQRRELERELADAAHRVLEHSGGAAATVGAIGNGLVVAVGDPQSIHSMLSPAGQAPIAARRKRRHFVLKMPCRMAFHR